MAAQYALLMAGTNGKRKTTKYSPISFTGTIINRYSWWRLAVHHSNVGMKQGGLTITAAIDKELVDIRDRRPLVPLPKATGEWMRQDVGGKEAKEITTDGSVPTDVFT